MAADLHIHVFVGITEEDLDVFFSHTLGSKRFNMNLYDRKQENGAYDRVSKTPSVWVGEVSWLKAALTEDTDAYVPEPVADIHELIGEDLPVLDEVLLTKLEASMKKPNGTGYSLASAEDVMKFLRKHMGKRLFTVSW